MERFEPSFLTAHSFNKLKSNDAKLNDQSRNQDGGKETNNLVEELTIKLDQNKELFKSVDTSKGLNDSKNYPDSEMQRTP